MMYVNAQKWYMWLFLNKLCDERLRFLIDEDLSSRRLFPEAINSTFADFSWCFISFLFDLNLEKAINEDNLG